MKDHICVVNMQTSDKEPVTEGRTAEGKMVELSQHYSGSLGPVNKRKRDRTRCEPLNLKQSICN